jgi:putative membrane protein
MKKNEFDFSIPNRQAHSGILFIILKTYKSIVRQVWPLLFLFILKPGSKAGVNIIFGVAIFALIGLIYGVVRYYRYRYYIKGEDFVIESGVLGKKKITIPFERIQTVNFEQSILHQVFSTTRLMVDTAGSQKEECSIDAIDLVSAESLRKLLLSKKLNKKKVPLSKSLEKESELSANEQLIMKLSPLGLIKAGLVENHLKSGALILIFLFWILERLREIGLDIDVDEYAEQIPEASINGTIYLFFLVFFIIISMLISMVRMILQNYDLSLVRHGEGFKLSAGLVTTRTVSALDHKIQHIQWSDNLLKKLFKIHDLRLFQASSAEVQSNKAIKVPGCTSEDLAFVTSALYPELKQDSILYKKPSILMLYRQIMYILLLSSVIFAFGCFYYQPLIYLALSIAYYLSFTAWLKYRKIEFGHDGETLVIRRGAFADKAEIFPIYKIQTIQVAQSIYQRRKDLATVHIYNASGSHSIPYIPKQEADQLANYLIYKVETARKKWM